MHKSWDFQVAEGPIKQLVMSFIKSNPINPEFVNYTKVMNSGLPLQFLEKSSLLRAPKAAEAIIIDVDNNKWTLKLAQVSSNHQWDEDVFKNFEKPELIKNTIGQMIKSAQLVFQMLKKKHKIMRNMHLRTDEENLTLFLEDSSDHHTSGERIFPLLSVSS